MSSVEPKRTHQIFLVILGIATASICFAIVRPFLLPLVAAIALAILFYPLHVQIQRRLKKPGLAAGLSVLLVLLFILVPATLLSIAVIRESQELYRLAADKSAAGGGWTEWSTDLLHRALEWAGVTSPNLEEQVRSSFVQYMEGMAAVLAQTGRMLLANFLSFFVASAVSLFSLFFLFRDGERLKNGLAEILPLGPGTVHRLFTEVGRSVLANVYGIAAVALIQGALTGSLFFFLGLRSPILWGTAAALFSMIPLLGPIVIWLPAAIILGLNGHWGKAAILAAFGAAVIGLADNFIRPYIIGGRVNIHPLLVFFALLGGVQAFGFLGLFIGPAALSVTIVILDLLRGKPIETPGPSLRE